MNENEREVEKEVPFLAPENMAFVHCPECYGEMPADAPACPHCGMAPHEDSDSQQKKSPFYTLTMILIGLGAAVIFAGLSFNFAGPGMLIGGVLLLIASFTKRHA